MEDYTMMKKSFKNRSAVSPVIATILMVAITVVLAAVLYVMVMGFGGTSSSAPTGSVASVEKVDNDELRFTFGTFSKETQFTDCKVAFGFDGVMGGAVVMNTAIPDVTFDTVVCEISYTDLGADGKISMGDYITVKTTASTIDLAEGEYTCTIIWGQDGSVIGTKSITV